MAQSGRAGSTSAQTAQKLLAKHSEIDAGRGQAYCTDLTHKSKRLYGDPGAPRTHGKRDVAQEEPVTIKTEMELDGGENSRPLSDHKPSSQWRPWSSSTLIVHLNICNQATCRNPSLSKQLPMRL